MKQILLVELGYKTKYPPLGLMKISSYHKQLGDDVTFVKGIVRDNKQWDRIYITTLFTYNWKVTVDTINYYKKFTNNIFVGGILASLMRDDLFAETGISSIKHNVLDVPDALEDGNDIIIDDLIPDYDLVKDHSYDLIEDSYFGYVTRGCINKCGFCAVHRLEPDFLEYKDIKPCIRGIQQRYGEKANLVLYDNNILASSKLDRIVDDLIELGFEKDSKYYSSKGSRGKRRRVDLNQGVDARLINKDNIKLLSKLAIIIMFCTTIRIPQKIYGKDFLLERFVIP